MWDAVSKMHLTGAMKFGVYEIFKPIFASLLRGKSETGGNTAVAFLMASVVAGGHDLCRLLESLSISTDSRKH